MTDPDAYRAALAALDLPPEWQVEVAIRLRRRTTGIQVNPGGGVEVLIPPTAAPEQVARVVYSHRRWITEKVDTATRLAPDHAVKQFVDGEEFDLLGRRYRLQLVNASPADAAQMPLITPDGVLTARRQRPELARRAVIRLYRQAGLAWLRREAGQYELDGHITGLSYAVRDLGRRRWGIYEGPPKHKTTLHWAVFGLPMRLIEYVLVHEQAHATQPGGRPHGRPWQRRMHFWMPDWQQRRTEFAETGRHAWLGDWNPTPSPPCCP
ncbi:MULTISPECIES: M48 family metallopeptidase [unclassified Crossiella]|uniref:M48 family metallopeptidase n=1 Tax=unclassified Crossiella TaxID=2620835 RepID=UPI001FFF7845|nr:MULTISPECIES: YgjP-like metallopeptidase domain-containing protein [unclassified Crossiella]MCK2240059.1 M48 family metallopeptidase [Crossiella sp. S99.2]MCK2252767.1 M48 family metallopeptidase [Crossiella sp. S99.1]